MKNPFFAYLYYTQRERNGIIALLSLIAFIQMVSYLLPYFISAPSIDLAANKAEIESFYKGLEAKKNTSLKEDSKKSIGASLLFPFNPNSVSKKSLISLGLTPRTAQSILNYRKKGGVFRKPLDFAKIYTLQKSDYERLKPWLRFTKDSTSAKTILAKAPSNREIIYFPFNPNTADLQTFTDLGLPKYTAQHIINYRNKGGKFKFKSDFKKIYTLKEEDYQKLYPFINLPEQSQNTRFQNTPTPAILAQKKDKLDINLASSIDFQQLYGIGPAYAKRIIKFRKALGGFLKIEQIAETFGMPDSTYQNIKGYLVCKPIIEKINVNLADEKKLYQHPYLSYYQAKEIIKHRNRYGKFKNVNMLQIIPALDDQKKPFIR